MADETKKTELPAHLESRIKDISEKAKAETANLDSYKALEDGYDTLSKHYSEGVERVVTEAFMDHFKKNDFKTEGFGASLYGAINAYFQKELLDYVPGDRGLAKMILKGFMGQIEDEKEQLLDYVKSKDRLSIDMVAQVSHFFGEKVVSPIKSAHIADVRRKATEDLDGFKSHMAKAAKEAGIPFNLEKITTVELGLKRYTSLMETIKKQKEEEEMLRKRFE